jgi:ABC-type phosphate/phosphonate transport system substrate-binding protein
VIVARAGEAGNSLADFAGRRIAINGRDSLSGYVMLVAAMRDAGMPVPTTRSWIETGSHRQSVRAVADGRADIAAIDAVCWALAERHDPGVLRRLRIIERTALRPALPFITAVTRSEADVALIRSAILHAIGSQATRSAADALFLTDVEVLGPQAYAPIADLLGTTQTIPGDASRASRG